MDNSIINEIIAQNMYKVFRLMELLNDRPDIIFFF